MLKKFKVKNFKNFSKELLFDLSKIGEYQFNDHVIKNKLVNKGVIYGENASGKSNLILAIMEIKYSTVSNLISTEYYENYVNLGSDSKYAEFIYEFKFSEAIVTYSYKKTSFNEYSAEKLVVDNDVVFSYDNLQEKESFILNVDTYPGLETLSISNWEQEISLLRFIFSNTVIPKESILNTLRTFIKGFSWIRPNDNAPRGIFNIGKAKSITNHLIENNQVQEFETFIHDTGLKNIKLSVQEDPEGKEKIYFSFNNGLLEFIPNASSGTKALLALYFITLLLEKTTLLLVDEFDANFHFQAAIITLKYLFEKDDTQMFVTSHNTDLMSNKNLRPDCVFSIGNGAINSIRDLTSRELRQGHNLEKLYQSGEFDSHE